MPNLTMGIEDHLPRGLGLRFESDLYSQRRLEPLPRPLTACPKMAQGPKRKNIGFLRHDALSADYQALVEEAVVMGKLDGMGVLNFK